MCERFFCLIALASLPALAQWQNLPAKGIPRTKDGRPDLSAPAPRKPDGKPDISGLWKGLRENVKYNDNMAVDFKPGQFPIQPWAEALARERTTDAAKAEFPPTRCLPPGIPIMDTQPFLPLKIIQEPDLVVTLNEGGNFRQIFLDGRTLVEDPNPTWWGYSVGRWDGDTLVVESRGFNGKIWLDAENGHPSTEALHIIERFRRRDFGHLDLSLTIDDPKAYNKPWTVTVRLQILLDTELLEYVCENEKDVLHLVPK